MNAPVVINELSFAHEVLKAELPVLVDVSTAWCPPCKAAAPIVAELAKRHAGRLKVVMLDGDEAKELVATLGVRGFPTFLGVRNGEIVARQAGFAGKRGLEALAEALLAVEPTPRLDVGKSPPPPPGHESPPPAGFTTTA